MHVLFFSGLSSIAAFCIQNTLSAVLIYLLGLDPSPYATFIRKFNWRELNFFLTESVSTDHHPGKKNLSTLQIQ